MTETPADSPAPADLAGALPQAGAHRALTPANVLITGGESITGITARGSLRLPRRRQQATPAEDAYFAQLPNAGAISGGSHQRRGDFSPYTLRLVNDAAQASQDTFDVTEALDRIRSATRGGELLLQGRVPPDFDCTPAVPTARPICRRRRRSTIWPRTMASFRTIMLDRMNQLLPSGAAARAKRIWASCSPSWSPTPATS